MKITDLRRIIREEIKYINESRFSKQELEKMNKEDLKFWYEITRKNWDAAIKQGNAKIAKEIGKDVDLIKKYYNKISEEKLNEETAEGYDKALRIFLDFIKKKSEEHYKKEYSNVYKGGYWTYPTVLKPGKKFDKLVDVRADEPKKAQSAHAFIERSTGYIYKAASWNAPAKDARASIFDPNSYKHFTSTTGWLYKRR